MHSRTNCGELWEDWRLLQGERRLLWLLRRLHIATQCVCSPQLNYRLTLFLFSLFPVLLPTPPPTSLVVIECRCDVLDEGDQCGVMELLGAEQHWQCAEGLFCNPNTEKCELIAGK